jgi:hypothetical protein
VRKVKPVKKSLLPNLSAKSKRVALSVLHTIKVEKQHKDCWHSRSGIRVDDNHCGLRRETTYCKHGSYVGYWDGPDYLCGYCEDGVSDYEYALSVAYEYQHNATREANNLIKDAMLSVVRENPDIFMSLHPDQREALFLATFNALKV